MGKITAVGAVLGVTSALIIGNLPVCGRDSGQFAGASPELHAWFNKLASHKGLCCSVADGLSIADIDWDTQGGKYRVRLDGQWVTVPDEAVVTDPNKFGPAVVWPVYSDDGNGSRTLNFIRCFMPGTLS